MSSTMPRGTSFLGRFRALLEVDDERIWMPWDLVGIPGAAYDGEIGAAERKRYEAVKFLVWLLVRGMPLAAFSSAALAPGAADARSEPSGVARAVLASGGQTGTSVDGWVAFGAIAIGVLLALLYVRGMYLVLHYASATYNTNLDRVDDADYSSSRERKLLSIGSVGLVVVSAAIIASYGFGWPFLYIGPALSLLGPIVIIASMESDIRKYRQALGEAEQAPSVVAGSAAART